MATKTVPTTTPDVAAKKAAKTPAKVETKFTAPLFSLSGKAAGETALPAEIFGVTINKALIAQALRVYITNRSGHWGQTKTRGQVAGSTRKIYRQKGTGKARHGANTAPIFIGGGRAMGPVVRRTKLALPQKMKKAALASALSYKTKEKNISAISDLDTAKGKTKAVAAFLKTQMVDSRPVSTLFVTEESNPEINRSVRNIQGVRVLRVSDLNVYDVTKHQKIIFSEAAIAKLANPGKAAV